MRILFTILLAFTFTVSIGCDCGTIKDLRKAQDKAFLDYELIFVGQFIQSTEDGHYQLKIIELFKGDTTKTGSVIRGKEMNSCSISPNFSERTWLVYSRPNDDGLIDISSCGLSRSFEFPFLANENASIPPPPPIVADPHIIDDTDKTESIEADVTELLDFEMQLTEYKEKALVVLKDEIAQLRKKRNGGE